MDYKEKYEQALENMRKFRDALNNHEILDLWVPRKEIVTDIEYYFPELKEGEDELEWLKQFIQEEAYSLSMDIRDNEDRSKLKKLQRSLEWLEKQGESIKIKKGKNYLCTKTHKYAGVEWIEGVKYYSPEDYSLINQGCTCYCPKYSKEEHNNFFKEVEYDGCLEKQGEQESIEWKDSDEKYLFWALLSIQKDIAASEINGVNTKDLNDCVKWLYSLKQRIKGE